MLVGDGDFLTEYNIACNGWTESSVSIALVIVITLFFRSSLFCAMPHQIMLDLYVE